MSEERYSLAGTAAERYERNMVPALFRPFAEDLLDHAELRPGQRILDVACGTGIVSRLAWPRVAPSGRVVGLDANAGMLDIARRAAAAEGASAEWVEGDAQALPWSDPQFDRVTCQAGIQYFPDRPAALAAMRRLLAPGGRLAANLWRDIAYSPGHHVLAEVLERHVSPEAGATRRAPFRLSGREEIRALFAAAGFSRIAMTISVRIARFPSAEAMVGIMMAGTPLGAKMADAPPDLIARVIDDVTSGLSDYEDDRGLALPIQAWVIVADK